MRYLVTGAEMKTYDKTTMEKIGIPGLVLMERAALETFYVFKEKGLLKRGGKALILAGYGNNGGDGLALGRMLCEAGMEVVVWLVGEKSKATEEWKAQECVLSSFPVKIVKEKPDGEYNVIVDALFGVGLSREVQGDYFDAIQKANQMTGFKLSMDVPSGVGSDRGNVYGIAFHADLTVTYGFEKIGLYLFPGSQMAGEIKLADVGISRRAFDGMTPSFFTLDEGREELLPVRRKNGNKGTFGKALIIAGSKNMAGAACLCAKACYRTGAGMVKILTPEENRIILQETIPEAMLGNLLSEESLRESIDWCDVLCIGPGLGKEPEAKNALRIILEAEERKLQKPLILDADGLNLLAENPELLQAASGQAEAGRQIILTPHAGEFLKLWNSCFEKINMQEYKEKPWEYAKAFAERWNVIVVAKDARTFICASGEPSCINLSGNCGMATAGSGDVLAGMITAMICQTFKSEPKVFLPVCRAVRLHGLNGDEAAKELGEHGVMAGDLIR